MKKIISVLTVLAMLLTCCVFSTGTAYAVEADYTYEVLSDGTVEITEYTGAGGNISVPATLGGYAVAGIGDRAFYQNKDIKEVTIPSGIQYIGERAFAGSFITGVNMADSVKSLGNSAFTFCIYLEDVTLSAGIDTLSNNCFSNCTRLENIVIPEGIKNIDVSAFQSSNHLTEVTLPSTLESIDEYAFAYTAITEIIIPEGVTEIKSYAFFLCESLSYVSIPSTAKKVSDWAFCNCSALTQVTLSEGVEVLGANAFDSCPIKTLRFPSTIQSIGEYAVGYYYDNSIFDYVKYDNFEMLCIKDTVAVDYAEENGFTYHIYSLTPDTEPTTPDTDPTVPDTYPSVPDTDPSVPDTDPSVPDTDPSVPDTDPSVPDTDPSVPDKTEPSSPKYEKGDVNMDSNVNVKDATAIQKHVADLIKLAPEALILAEYDGDTRITVKDATAIQKFIAGLI